MSTSWSKQSHMASLPFQMWYELPNPSSDMISYVNGRGHCFFPIPFLNAFMMHNRAKKINKVRLIWSATPFCWDIYAKFCLCWIPLSISYCLSLLYKCSRLFMRRNFFQHDDICSTMYQQHFSRVDNIKKIWWCRWKCRSRKLVRIWPRSQSGLNYLFKIPVMERLNQLTS